MMECLDCGDPVEDVIWEKYEGKCKECRADPVQVGDNKPQHLDAYSDARKLEIVTAYLQGTDETQEDLCKRIGIAVNVFQRWRNQFKTVAHAANRTDEKPTRRTFTKDEKLEILEKYNQAEHQSIEKYCKSIGIHYATFYSWKSLCFNEIDQPKESTAPTENVDELIAELADMKRGVDVSSIIDKIGIWRTREDNLRQGEIPGQFAAKILARCLDDIEYELTQLEKHDE